MTSSSTFRWNRRARARASGTGPRSSICGRWRASRSRVPGLRTKRRAPTPRRSRFPSPFPRAGPGGCQCRNGPSTVEEEIAMYPSRFHYEAPSSLDEALQLLSMYQGEAKVLSGGMSLIPLMKLRFATPSAVIDVPHTPGRAPPRPVSDVNTIPGLESRAEEGGHLRIGALTRNRDIIRSDVVRARYPLM